MAALLLISLLVVLPRLVSELSNLNYSPLGFFVYFVLNLPVSFSKLEALLIEAGSISWGNSSS